MKFSDPNAQWREIEPEALPDVIRVLRDGQLILGPRMEELEDAISQYLGVKHAVAVASGTDALRLAFANINPDFPTEVQANGHISDVMAAGDRTVFVDCDEWFGMDVSQHDSSRLSLVTHMYGQVSQIPEYGHFIEDCAQAFGAKYPDGSYAGTKGWAGCFSFYPTKNLGACGDGGMIVTNDVDFADSCRELRNYGTNGQGANSRLDEVQAVILLHKLAYVDKWCARRREIASFYEDMLKDVDQIQTPKQSPWSGDHTWHIYALLAEKRDELKAYLETQGVPTLIHYDKDLPSRVNKPPMPRALDNTKKLLSLPIHPYLSDGDVAHVVASIKGFYARVH